MDGGVRYILCTASIPGGPPPGADPAAEFQVALEVGGVTDGRLQVWAQVGVPLLGGRPTSTVVRCTNWGITNYHAASVSDA